MLNFLKNTEKAELVNSVNPNSKIRQNVGLDELKISRIIKTFLLLFSGFWNEMKDSIDKSFN